MISENRFNEIKARMMRDIRNAARQPEPPPKRRRTKVDVGNAGMLFLAKAARRESGAADSADAYRRGRGWS